MVDRELEVTGVAAEGFDAEEAVTGVPAGSPVIDPDPERGKLRAAFMGTSPQVGLGTLLGVEPERPEPFNINKMRESIEASQGGAMAWTDDDYTLVQGYLWSQFPDLKDDAHATSRFMKKIMGQTELYGTGFIDLLYEDVNAALSVADDEEYFYQHVEKMNRGEPDVIAAALMSAYVAHAEEDHPYVAMGKLRESQDAVDREFEASQVSVRDLASAVDPALFGGKKPEHILETLAASDEAKAVLNRDGFYRVDDRHLLVTLQDDAGPMQAFVVLDEGTEINTELDALAALAEAKTGLRHQLVEDETAGTRTAVGAAFRKLGDTIRFIEDRVPDPLNLFAPSDDEIREQAESFSRNDVESGNAAGRIYSEMLRGGYAPGIDTFAAAEDLVASDEFADASQEEIYRLLKEDVEKEGAFVPVFTETVMPRVVHALEWYDKTVVHTIGRNLLDAGTAGILKSAVDEAADAEYVSEMFGIDPSSTWGTWLNLAASVGFDPFTYFTPGARASWKLQEELLTNPALLSKGAILKTPHAQSAIRQAVVKNDSRIALSLLHGATDPDAIIRIGKIASTDIARAERKAAYREIENILTKGVQNGTIMPPNPTSFIQAKNAMGAGVAFQRLSKALSRLPTGGSLRGWQQNLLNDWGRVWARVGKERSVPVGRHDFLPAVADQATAIFGPVDMGKAWDVIERAAKAQKAGLAGTADEIGALSLKLDEVNRTARVARGPINADPDLASVPAKREFLQRLDDIVAEADAGGVLPAVDDLDVPGGAGSQLNETVYDLRDRIRAEVEMYGPQYDELDQARQAAVLERQRINDEIARLKAPTDTHSTERFWYEWYDEIGDWLGLERLEGDEFTHPFLKDADGNAKQLHDWEPVTGKRTAPIGKSEDASWYAGFVGDVSKYEDSVQALKDVGIGPKRTHSIMPASTLEILQYKHGSKLLRDRLNVPANAVSSGLDRVQNAYASTLLLNPITSIRAQVDEAARFIQAAGIDKGRNIVDPFMIGRTDDLSTRGAALIRDMDNTPYARGAGAQWEMMDPSDKGQWRAAERFVNGGVLRNGEDPAMRAWAQAKLSEDFSIWSEWWDRHKWAYAPTNRGRNMSAKQSYDVIGNNWELLMKRPGTKGVKEGVPEKVLQAASEGRPVKLKPEEWRTFPTVPGEPLASKSALKRPIDALFNGLYGIPSQRRTGVIFDWYYQKYLNISIKRAERNGGRIIYDLNPDNEATKLVNAGVAEDMTQARDMVAGGLSNPHVRDLVKTHGWVLESELDGAAARLAESTAQSMMYQMNFSSLGGKRLARLYPWGRAQMDYMAWWFQQITTPTQYRIPGIKTGFLPKIGTTTGRDYNLFNHVNARLLNRIGHLVTMGEPDEYPGAGTPAWMTDEFSFLPTRLDKSFVVENSVSTGWAGSFAVNWLPIEAGEDADTKTKVFAGLRDAFDFLHPAHALYQADVENNAQNWRGNLIDEVFPTGSRSLRTLAGALYGYGLSMTGANPNAEYNNLVARAEPRAFRSIHTMKLAELLQDDAYSYASDTDQGAPWGQELKRIYDESIPAAYGANLMETLATFIGIEDFFGENSDVVAMYYPMEDWIDGWVEAGYINANDVDNWLTAKQVVEGEAQRPEGITSRDARNLFVDISRDILTKSLPQGERDRFTVLNTGVAANFAARVRIAPDADLPEKWQEWISDGEIVATGDLRRQMYEEGIPAGWIISRDYEDIVSDVTRAKDYAAAGALKDIYENDLGIPWKTNKKDILALNVPIDADTAAEWGRYFDRLHMDPNEDWQQPDGSWIVPVGEFKDWMRSYIGEGGRYYTGFTADRGAGIQLGTSDTGRAIIQEIEAIEDLISAHNSSSDPFTLPGLEEVELESISDLLDYPGFEEAIFQPLRQKLVMEMEDNKNFTPGSYRRSLEPLLGPLDYTAPDPPAEADLEFKFTGKGNFKVVDGDTLEFQAADGGTVPFRLMGINAAEASTEEGVVATEALKALIRQADTVTVGLFDRQRYGTTQTFYTRNPDGTPARRDRVFGWLYIDGQPVWFPELFSPTNERGEPRGDNNIVPDYSQWMKAGI